MMSEYKPEHINYALVEDTRPPMYRAMKYWGRKPHNIWGDYIEHYCPADGIVLDPFMGSGISTFESLKRGRKVISTDLNPLSAFVVETLASDFNEDLFKAAVESIRLEILADDVYKYHFQKVVDGQSATVYNYLSSINQDKTAVLCWRGGIGVRGDARMSCIRLYDRRSLRDSKTLSSTS